MTQPHVLNKGNDLCGWQKMVFVRTDVAFSAKSFDVWRKFVIFAV